MRVIHTSDWHLGQKFISQTREAEQQLALDWLLQQVVALRADVLVVAGDIFDVHNPPVGAEEMYYRFLTQLTATDCRHVVIIGGNHDSPYRLNAPRGLLRALRIHVVGAATGHPNDEILHLQDPEGRTEAIVAAVPFLRERDLGSTTTVAETPESRIERIQQGILGHYEQIADAIGQVQDIPVIATGHLYARGASTHEEQANIYMGNLDNISAEGFPKAFDYVALGHIHRMQVVGKKQHIRYCGSLIPLSFSEKNEKKGVIFIEFDKNKIAQIQEIETPTFRKLVTIKGELPDVEHKLEQLNDPTLPLPSWVEIVVTGNPGIVLLDQHLRDFCAEYHLDILKVRYERPASALAQNAPKQDLAALAPREVFLKKCEAAGLSPEKTAQVLAEFDALLEEMGAAGS
jgi:DNA repair protein SbcD/Mre11